MTFLRSLSLKKLLWMEYFFIDELWIPKNKYSSPQSQRFNLFVNQSLDDKVTAFKKKIDKKKISH